MIKLNKVTFYATNILRGLVPSIVYQSKLKLWLKKEKSINQEAFQERLNYYITTSTNSSPKNNWVSLKDFKKPKKGSAYYYDLLRISKYFPRNKKINFKFGDVTEIFEEPTLVKSRPIQHNGNSVIMKLNAIRHFNFIEDKLAFKDKKDLIVWRGEVHKESRKLLVSMFYNHPECNIGDVKVKKDFIPEWQKEFLSPEQQMEYKFIVSIEGNDVASNLKWIMNSNSLCFMPKPKFETWFMEGKLIPGYHYVLIKDDYSDLLEKKNFYLNNPEKALEIITNAQAWTAQFKDERLEKKLSISVLNQFFEQTNQN